MPRVKSVWDNVSEMERTALNIKRLKQINERKDSKDAEVL
jgi:hypothetical protein